MDNAQLREFLVAVVARADVSRTQLRLLICTFELTRFLGWDGIGLFQKARIRPKGADRFRMLYSPACLICTRPEYAVPVRPCETCEPHPDQRLIALLKEASELRNFMLSNRTKSISELALEKKMGSRWFARLLRVNYLAPDIHAAIMDGSQPADLTASKVILSAMSTDWEHQRRLFGFPSLTP